MNRKPITDKKLHTRELQILLVEGLAEKTALDEIETLIIAVRDEILNLDYNEKTKRDYIYCGFGTILRYFQLNNCHDFSKATPHNPTKKQRLVYKLKTIMQLPKISFTRQPN